MTKNRHELPRKKPGRNAKDEIAEDLPTLEPLADELPTLQPVEADLPALEPVDAEDDGPIKVACTSGGEAGFDTVISCTVPAMDKKAVPDAVKVPLQRAMTTNSAKLRHHKVLVRFAGEAMVGSAVKDLVAELLKAHKPLLGVVRRGFGDETVAQGKLPEVAVVANDQGGVTKVEVSTGELDALDLPMAFLPHVDRLAATARGKKFMFAFAGKAKPDAALRAQMTKVLQDAGAVRAAIGERVLFDRELAERVTCKVAGDTATIGVKPAADDATTIDALTMVLPAHADACRGKVVRIEFSTASAKARDFCIEFAKKSGAVRIAVGDDIVWPKLVSLVAGAETTLRLAAHGRSRAGVLAAFRAEGAEHAAATKGKALVVDWPAGFVLDAEAEACLRDVATTLQGKSVSCTVGGEQREPFLPEPMAFAADADTVVIRIDSEAGKPVELQRAIDRRLPGRVKDLRGKAVRVEVAGSAAVSRTLLRGVLTTLEAAGVMRLEVAEGGSVDVWLPAMLTVTKSGTDVRIVAMTAGRDAAQLQKALGREIEAAGLSAGGTVTVGASAAAAAVVAAVVAKGVGRVLLDGPPPVQVHPPLLTAPDKKGLNVRIAVAAGADAAMVARQLDRELPGYVSGLGLLATSTVTIGWSGGDPASAPVQRLVKALVDKKASKVLFDGGAGKPQQVHPVVAPPPVPAAPPAAAAPAAGTAAGAPAAPPALPGARPAPSAPAPGGATSAGMVRLLSRNDDAVPPMVLVGIAAATDEVQLAAIEAELQTHSARFRGRAVLLVVRAGDQDVPVRKPDAMVDLLRRTVPATAAATLIFRGPDAQGRPHFQVLHSTLRALPVGGTFGDPRTRR